MRCSDLLRALCILSVVFLAGSPLAQENKSQEDKKEEKKEEGLPLKAETKVEFTTDEGTWMSLDVSPDGQTILFDLLGDIYTLPVAGGAAGRKTSGSPASTARIPSNFRRAATSCSVPLHGLGTASTFWYRKQTNRLEPSPCGCITRTAARGCR